MIKTGKKRKRPFYTIINTLNTAGERVKEKWLIVLCAVSLFSSFADMPLCCLSLVLIETAEYRMTKYICSAVAAAYFLSTVIYTAFYIPYIAFIFICLVADYLLENSTIKSVWPAAVTFVAVKGYMLSFGYETTHWVLFAFELFAVAFMPSCAAEGFCILKNNENCQSTENIFYAFSALALAAFSLDGLHIWGISFSVAFLLGAAMFYGLKNNFVLSFAAVFVMMLSLCQHDNCVLLYAGFSVVYISSVIFIPKGIKGYAACMTVSAAVTMLFISYFNSIVIFSTSAVAAAGCFLAERCGFADNVLYNETDEFAGERDYIQLKEKIEKLNRCFRFLGYTITDISSLMVKDFVPVALEDAVSGEVCRKCRNNTQCWQQDYSRTQKQFSVYAKELEKNNTPAFEAWFYNVCGRTEQLRESFENHNRLNVTQKIIHSQGQHNQKLLQNQFLAMAEVLKEIAVQSSKSGVANTALTHKASSFMQMSGKVFSYCVCYQNPDRCIVSTRDIFDTDECYKFKSKLESLYGEKFSLPSSCSDGENIIYTFSRVPMFGCEYGAKSTGRYTSCGDECEHFTAENSAYVILADGMGTGCFAAAESKTAVAMLKNLLMSSVKVETALEITNTALNLKGTGQSCVAVDILQVNLYDGSCNLYKAGGAPAVILSGEKNRILYKDSLPVGVLKEIKIAQFSFILNNGDTVVLASDGVGTDSCVAKLNLAGCACTPQQLAEYAVKNADGSDDATAAVIKLVRT